ncbi:MAG: choice-of-anchor J domain-containing protein [Hyphomicrobiales bacterium]
MLKRYTILSLLILFCLLGYGQVTNINESFDEIGTPTGWTIVDEDGDYNKWGYKSTIGNRNNGSMELEGTESYTDDYLITSQVTITEGGFISFYLSNINASDNDKLDLVFSTTDKEVSSFTKVQECSFGNEWTKFKIPFSDIEGISNGDNVYFAWKSNAYYPNNVYLDDVTIGSPKPEVSPKEFSLTCEEGVPSTIKDAISIKNNAEEPLTINSVSALSDNFSTSLPEVLSSISIASNEIYSFDITISGNTIGSITETLIIETSGGTISVELSANIIEKATASTNFVIDFEGDTPPENVEFIDYNEDANTWKVEAKKPYKGSKAAISKRNDWTATDDWVISPKILVEEGNKICFYLASPENSSEKVDILISKSNKNIQDFTITAGNIVDIPKDYKYYEYYFDKIEGLNIGDEIYVAIRHHSINGWTNKYLALDNIELKDSSTPNDQANILSCTTDGLMEDFVINNKNISGKVYNTIDISNLSLNIEVSRGATISPTTPKDFTNGAVPFTVTSEDGNTTNTYYITVKKEIESQTSLIENFNKFTLPSDWSAVNNNEDYYKWGVSSSANYSGENSKGAYINSNATMNHDDYLISPPLKVTENSRIAFFVINKYNDSFEVLLSKTGKSISDFNISLEECEDVNNSWTLKLYDLSNCEDINTGDKIYFAIKATGKNGHYVYFDQFKFGEFELEKKIESFEFENLMVENAIINHENNTITATVKPEADITNLEPTIISSPLTTVTPTGARNFTDPVEYTVSGDDKSTIYTVTVERQKYSEARITSFSLEDEIMDSRLDYHIGNKAGTIKAFLPNKYDVTNLIPSITASPGASISPDITQATDFTDPVTITVTSEDETNISTYTVTIETDPDPCTSLIENFDSSNAPNFWKTTNANDDNRAWEISTENHNEGGSHSFTIRYSSQNVAHNDFIISPALLVENNSTISFWVKTTDPAESYEILLSKTGQEVENFSVELEKIGPEKHDWVKKEYNLNNCEDIEIGDKIYFAFRATGTYGLDVYFDEFKYENKTPETKILDVDFTGLKKETLVINHENNTVFGMVENDVNLTSLKPTFTISEGATISIDTEQDFTNSPIQYTVSSGNTNTTYDVTFTKEEVAAEGLTEEFESDNLPVFWTVIDNDADGKSWVIANSDSHNGQHCIKSEGSTGNTQDNWLISPKIKVRENDRLSFYAKSSDISKLEDFNVKVSKGGKAVSDFTISLGEVKSASSLYTEYTYRLDDNSGIDIGDEIYIAIQNVSIDKQDLLVDSFVVETVIPIPVISINYDMALLSAENNKSISTDKVYCIKNNGEGILTITDIEGLNNTGFSTSIVNGDVSLNAGESYLFNITFNPTSLGSHNTNLIIKSNGGDTSIKLEGYSYNENSTLQSFEETDPLKDWTLVDLDEDGANFEILEKPEEELYIFGKKCIVSKVKSQETNRAGINNLLMTPQLKVKENDKLVFWADGNNGDNVNFSVKLSTGGNNVEAFTEVIAENITAVNTLTKYEYDLTDYVGKDVYIYIQHHNDQEDCTLIIDNIIIPGRIVNEVDLVLTPSKLEYVQTPTKQSNFIFTTKVENKSEKDLTDATSITYKIENSDYSFSADLSIPFKAGEAQTFSADTKPFKTTEKGEYTVNIELSNILDANLDDNKASYKFIVSDTIMAREDGVNTTSLALDNTEKIIGQKFEINTEDYLSSVSVYLVNPVVGNKIKVQIREYTSENGPTKIIYEIKEYKINTDKSSFVHIEIPNGLKLTKGEYFIGIQNLDSKVTKIAATDKFYTPATAYVYNDQVWNKIEDIEGDNKLTFLIRANLNTKVGINNLSKIDFNLAPNPAKEFVNINSNENASLVIYNSIGDMVYSKEIFKGMNRINLNQLSSGSYIIKLINDNKQSVQKLVIQ